MMPSPIASEPVRPAATMPYAPDPDAGLPVNPVHLVHCSAIWQMTEEMLALATGHGAMRRDRRRLACHARQIAMYVCHVVLRLSLSQIGRAFGRDRTTVGHACHVVEDRRDDPAFEAFVSALERVARRLVEPPAGGIHG